MPGPASPRPSLARFLTASTTTLAISCGTLILAPVSAHATEIDLGDLTVVATTDIHAHAADYDYFTGQSYGAKDPTKALGMDHLSTAIKQVQTEYGLESVLTLDNGDANQGSSLATYYQGHRSPTTTDPMASVFNLLNYDAGVVGNHEFNYGLGALDQYQSNLDMPLLGANVIDDATGEPALTPYIMTEKTVNGHPVKVGVVGVVTPGIATWDKANVEGKLHFEDAAQSANTYARQAKADGADVVVVLAHTGLDPEGVPYDADAKGENVARSVAEQSTDIDVVVGDHSHVTDKVQEYFINQNGEKVLFSQPGYWARFASEITIPLQVDKQSGKVFVEWSAEEQPTARALNAADFVVDPAVVAAVEPYHSETQHWVKTVVAQSTKRMVAENSAWEDTPILDFISRVQTDEVARALKGTEFGNLPLISEVSPFSRTAEFKQGDVTIADMAGLYTYDNTLYAVKLTGAQLKDYLEWSARYYKQQPEGAEITDWSTVTNAQYRGDTRGIPDYSYDALSGVNYHLNISRPAGERVENLTLADGSPLADDAEVILALNNYRWSGGSGYPHVTDAQVVYNEQKAVRDLMIEWAIEHQVIDPADFFVENWSVSTSSKVPTDPSTGKPTPVTSENPSVTSPVEASRPEQSEGAEPSMSTEPAKVESAGVKPSVTEGAKDEGADPNKSASVAIAGDTGADSDGAMAANTSAERSGWLAHTGFSGRAIAGAGAALLAIGVVGIRIARRRS